MQLERVRVWLPLEKVWWLQLRRAKVRESWDGCSLKTGEVDGT